MPYLKTEGNIKIYYNYYKPNFKSKKPILLFIHGWLVNWTIFEQEIKYFKKKGYPILYLDLRGHGLSDKPKLPESYSIACMAKDIKLILIKEKIKKVVPIGFSLGGMVALMFNILYNQYVEKLILIDTSYKNPLFFSKISFFTFHKSFIKKLSKTLAKLLRYSVKRLEKKHEINFTKIKGISDSLLFLKATYSTPLIVNLGCLNAMFEYDVKDQLSKLNNSVLVITSKSDQFFKNKLGVVFVNNIKKAQLISIKGTHSILLKQPKIIEDSIENFLDS